MQIGDLVRWIDYCEIQYVGYWLERVGVIIGKGLPGSNLAYPKTIFIVATNGSEDQPLEIGTTSVCPDKIIAFFPFVFFALIVPKRFTRSLFPSKTLKVETPFFFKISSQ